MLDKLFERTMRESISMSRGDRDSEFNEDLLDDFEADDQSYKHYDPFEEFSEPGQEVPWGSDPYEKS